MIMQRRAFLTGLGAFIAAPAVIRVAALMPVKVFRPSVELSDYGVYEATLMRAIADNLGISYEQLLRDFPRTLPGESSFSAALMTTEGKQMLSPSPCRQST
jgi:hypothetical protein